MYKYIQATAGEEHTMTRSNQAFRSLVGFLSTFFLLSSSFIWAQAWVPPKGDVSYSVIYQNVFSSDHFFSSGKKFDVGHIRSHGVIQYFEYGLTDKTALSLSLPFIASKYKGERPHRNPGNTDDGSYHGAFQDFRFGLRHNVRTRPLIVTPFVEVILPSHDYEILGHAVIGRNLRELLVGLNVARRLDPLLSRGYFQTQYSYGITQRIQGIRPNRSRLDAEVGYFVNRRLAVRALQMLQITHEGLNFPEDHRGISAERYHYHDVISRNNFYNVGGGASFTINESWQVFGSLISTVWGQNGGAIRSVMVGMNWYLPTRRSETAASSLPKASSAN